MANSESGRKIELLPSKELSDNIDKYSPETTPRQPPSPNAETTHEDYPNITTHSNQHINISRIINPLQIFRVLMSKNRRRIVQDQYDLDLTYITDRIIAMSIPGVTPLLSVVCNPVSQVQHFLNQYHPNCYKVYNLCVEYPYKGEELFQGRYAYYPTEDMQPPALDMMHRFCVDATEWLKANENNVVVVHCKGGKGRTGCVICALLTYLGVVQQEEEYADFGNPEHSLDRFASVRTVDRKGITRASQKNYVRNYGKIVKLQELGTFDIVHPIRLLTLSIFGLNEDLQRSGRLLVKVYFRRQGKAVAEKVARAEIQSKDTGVSKQEFQYKGRTYRAWSVSESITLDFSPLFESMQDQWVLQGDIKVSVKMYRPTKVLFYTWFSTTVTKCHENSTDGKITANFFSLDKPYKKMFSKRENIQIELTYTKLDSQPVVASSSNQDDLQNFQIMEQKDESVWDMELVHKMILSRQSLVGALENNSLQLQQLDKSSEYSKTAEIDEEDEDDEVTSGKNQRYQNCEDSLDLDHL
eukprot:TRINITY_DN41343_c0_g1_i2.p1 TRINITY_DN41343_c0_g1~~TRINITY_DN41343_c0_g1_i2.p1  ORF type:complete len:526 (-),score=40.53 TRINITY_DN41343_c0_g1_i2:449-2026(-)